MGAERFDIDMDHSAPVEFPPERQADMLRESIGGKPDRLDEFEFKASVPSLGNLDRDRRMASQAASVNSPRRLPANAVAHIARGSAFRGCARWRRRYADEPQLRRDACIPGGSDLDPPRAAVDGRPSQVEPANPPSHTLAPTAATARRRRGLIPGHELHRALVPGVGSGSRRWHWSISRAPRRGPSRPRSCRPCRWAWSVQSGC